MSTFILVTPAYDSKISKYTLNDYYTKAILKSGGIPIITPYENMNHIDDILDNVSGIVLTGGGDIHARFFDQELDERAGSVNVLRDEFEINLCNEALRRDLPILAICRGMQVLNVAIGGDIKQHIDGHFDKNDDDLMHTIKLEKDSYFHNLFQKECFDVNSIHHQALDITNDDVEILAYCGDIIEAIKVKNKKFVVGVQYHPERIYDTHDESRLLFDTFIKYCRKG